MTTRDVVVVGAGIVGAACADVASAEGLSVTIVESGIVGGGVTAAGMGHLVALDGSPAELALAVYSLTFWESLGRLPKSEYSRCGTLWVAGDEADFRRIPDKLARLEDAGVVAESVDAARLRKLEPELSPQLTGGVLVPGDGVVYAPTVTRRLVERACGRGARLIHANAVAVGDHEVRLADGSRLTGEILVANGCGLPTLLPELPLRPRKGHLVITQRYPGTIRHQLVQLHYTDSVHGTDSSVAFNVQPRPTGQLLIGSSREFDDATPEVSLPMLQRMLQRTFEFLPGLRQLNALRTWTGQRPASIDGEPYIGRVPGRQGVWVAAGHEGLGVTTAPGTARLWLDLFLGRSPAIDAQPFDPARAAA